MQKYFYASLLLLLPAGLFGQFGLPAGFDTKTFSKDEELVFWLLKYDSVMQQTPVPSMQLDRPEDDYAFAWTDKKNNWHAVHGKIDSAGHFQVALHQQTDSKNKIKVSKDKLDTAFAGGAARSMRQAQIQLKKDLPNDWKKMQRFVRRNADNGYTVWYLPEYNPGSPAWCGIECVYYFDASGRVLVSSKKTIKPVLSFEPDTKKEITLDYASEKMPTLGAMFFAHRHQTRFQNISVKYKKGTSTLIYFPNEKTYAWQHAAG